MTNRQPSRSDDPTASDEQYRPDPGRETRQVIDSFIEAVACSEPDAPELAARIRKRHRNLISARHARPGDELSWLHLKTALVVLAAYRELQGRYPDQSLLSRLQEAFVEPLRPFVADATRAALDAAPDPFSTMVALTRERERSFFGPGFDFAHPRNDDRVYVSEVRRCFYHDVLVAYDAAHLTPILCAFDATWIDVIDPDRHRFVFDRASTIGTGGASCPFRFSRQLPGTE